MNEILVVHNDLIDLEMKGFSASEIDMLNAICYFCQEKGESVTLKLSDIRKLADYKSVDTNRFYRDLEKTVDKLSTLKIRMGTDREYVKFVLFPKFKVSESSGTVDIEVSKDFRYMLNEFNNNYSMLEMMQSAALTSKYAKNIYKKLRKFRSTGKWIVSIEDFRSYLDIPKGFAVGKIDQRIINPSVEELKPYFDGLSCTKQYESGGRGRPRVKGYEFTFKSVKKEQNELDVNTIATMGNWERTNLYCPVCREKVYKKAMHNENGDYFIYGHPDFKTGKCSQVFTNATDCIPASQIEAEKEAAAKAENLTEEECKANKKIIAGFMELIFGR